MVDSKITDLAALTGVNLATGDVFEVSDISDTSMDASGTSKKITGTELAVGVRALGSDAVYGDGSDGTVTFDGTTTILGLAPSSSTYTMSRDLWLAAGTINSGVTVITGGFRLFCAGTLTNNGTISRDGANAAASTAGGQPATGTASTGQGGGNGTTGAGATVTGGANALGGNGGNGGAGGTGAAGSGGTVSAPAANVGSVRTLPQAITGILLAAVGNANTTAYSVVRGGAGGGGGGGDGTNAGGGGGAGAGVMILAARSFAGTGAIHARGGNGANGVAGNAGGGGGGGGGLVIIVSASVAGGAINGQTIDANGGSLGTKTGTGVNGVAGSSGTVVLIAN